MKQIELTKGHYAIVDDEDFECLSKLKWCALVRGSLTHARHGSSRVYMHRHIMGVTDPNVFVDHINGNGLDNRRCNLRICSRMENGYNRGPAKNNKTGFKGVVKVQRAGRWIAQIRAQKKTICLGFFSTPEDAAMAYDAKAKELHGPFCRTNF